MIPLKDMRRITGCVRGGCSPPAMKKRFPTHIHDSALESPAIRVCAGLSCPQLPVAPRDLAAAAEAVFADLVRPLLSVNPTGSGAPPSARR
ncbi:MAG: hypothetical protein LBJ46_02225 [Planctomycetota bacterium]|nr:hypothetical protein [Planctomycetota bacterium]